MTEKVAFSPKEFAALFSKEQSWGYRQIYAGKISTITEYGRILIPAAEVEKILASAGRYEGQKKLPRTKKQLEKLKPRLQDAWTSFVRARKQEGPSGADPKKGRKAHGGVNERQEVLRRLSRE